MTKRFPPAAAALAFVFLLGTMVAGDAKPPGEYEVKAAFLFRFSQFVEWPAKASGLPDGAIVIGIVGKDPFGGALEAIAANRTTGGRALNLRYFPRADEVEPCHIVFVTHEAARDLPRILKSLENSAVLVVGESDDFAESGGAIELFLEERRVRFEINVEAAERSGIRINSRVLSLARIVRAGVEKRGTAP